jgi:hypothetical protein
LFWLAVAAALAPMVTLLPAAEVLEVIYPVATILLQEKHLQSQ